MANEIAASERHLTTSSPTSNDKTKLAMYHAKLILGSYRADEANDPKVYVTAISHLLSRYPPDIGARLTDPKDGVAGKYKWLPSVSEVKEEADRLEAADAAKQYRAAEWSKQLQLRREQETLDKSESWEHRQKVTARIMAEYKATLTPAKPPDTWKRFTVDDLKAMYARADGTTPEREVDRNQSGV